MANDIKYKLCYQNFDTTTIKFFLWIHFEIFKVFKLDTTKMGFLKPGMKTRLESATEFVKTSYHIAFIPFVIYMGMLCIIYNKYVKYIGSRYAIV